MANRWQRFTRAVGRILRGGQQPTYQPPPRPTPPPRPSPPTELPPLPPPQQPPLLPPQPPPYVPPPYQESFWEEPYTEPKNVPLFGDIQSGDQVISVYFEGIFIGTADWATWYNDTVHMNGEAFEDKYMVTQYSVLIYLAEVYHWTQEDWDAWRAEYISSY